MNQRELVISILELEWDMFTTASNAGGRADCQDDRLTFNIMRGAQTEIWSLDTLRSYRDDLQRAKNMGINLMSIKYARMMEQTFPEEFALIEDQLPEISPKAAEYVSEIMKYHSRWSREASDKYPKLFSMGRPLTARDAKGGRWASVDNYLRCELLTYSLETLAFCLRDTKNADAEGLNLAIEILWNTAKSYGYSSLDQIEAVLNR